VLVPISAGPAPARAPRREPAAPDGVGGRVIPIRRPGEVQLVRSLIGGQEPYADFLDKVPDLMPGGYGAHVAAGIVPNEDEIANLPEMSRAIAVDPNTQAHEDPAADAFGGGGMRSAGIKPLGNGGGS
jgi:hypothetical protein